MSNRIDQLFSDLRDAAIARDEYYAEAMGGATRAGFDECDAHLLALRGEPDFSVAATPEEVDALLDRHPHLVGVFAVEQPVERDAGSPCRVEA
jgi:ABC-type sugar transport system substrate-binding protein